MARTTGKSGFKMRSGNTTTFKYMGSSPITRSGDVTTEDKTKIDEIYENEFNDETTPMKKFTPVANIKANVKALGKRIKSKVANIKSKVADIKSSEKKEVNTETTTSTSADTTVASATTPTTPETPSAPTVKRVKKAPTRNYKKGYYGA